MAFQTNTSLSAIPLDKPAQGISPDIVDAQTLAPTLIAVNIVMMTWALFFVIIRLYANFHAPRGLKIDDYFCIAATVLALTSTGVIISMNSMTRHVFAVTMIDGDYLKQIYAETIITALIFFFAKSAIFLLYFRIFAIDKSMRYGVWFGLAWTFLIYWIGVPLATYFCAPHIGMAWDSEKTKCRKEEIYGVIQGVLSVVLDLYIFFLPIPIVLRLHMSLKRRLSILAVFGTAILGIAAAVVGMVYRLKFYTSDDTLWISAAVEICVTCESYVAIIVGSMPAFVSFFKGKMPGASWLASLNSLVLKSKKGASSSKIELSHRSNTGIPFAGDSTVPAGHARDKGYFELHETRHLGDCELGSVRTEIRGEGAGPRTLEEGVVRKTIAVDQSMKQEPSTAWDSDTEILMTYDMPHAYSQTDSLRFHRI